MTTHTYCFLLPRTCRSRGFVSQYLSNADDRLKWQANELPSDDLCVENAIMIKRFNRYPLIIDPSGQATEFIMNEYRDRKITKTRLHHAHLHPL